MKKRISMVALTILALLAVVGCVQLVRKGSIPDVQSGNMVYGIDPAAHAPEKTKPIEITGNKIKIPCMDSLYFQADTLNQKVQIENPESNACYFCITVLLSGETLYQSGLLPPGQVITDIALLKALNAGTYSDATLVYNCFDLTDKCSRRPSLTPNSRAKMFYCRIKLSS